MLCNKCGTDNNERSTFCKECGAPISNNSGGAQSVNNTNSVSATARKPKRKLKKLIISGVAAVVVVAGIAVGAFTLINSQSNTVGNTSANLANIGISAKQGDWIYYITVDSAKSSSNGPTGISKMHTDGSGVIKVTSEIGYYLNVKGDWIYYVGFNRDSSNGNSSGPSGIYKMRTDGTNKITLTSDTAMDINVIGDWIYYVGYTDLNNSGSGAIYKIRTDGTNKSKLDGSSNLSSSGGGYSNLSLNVVGDWIYYVGNVDDSNSDSNNVAIYKIHTDGSNQTKLDSGLAASINVIGDWIYYVSTSDGTSSRGIVTADSHFKSRYNSVISVPSQLQS